MCINGTRRSLENQELRLIPVAPEGLAERVGWGALRAPSMPDSPKVPDESNLSGFVHTPSPDGIKKPPRGGPFYFIGGEGGIARGRGRPLVLRFAPDRRGSSRVVQNRSAILSNPLVHTVGSNPTLTARPMEMKKPPEGGIFISNGGEGGMGPPSGRPPTASASRANKNGPVRAVFVCGLAERVGFEPTDGLPHRLISSQVHSTTLPPLHMMAFYNNPVFGRGFRHKVNPLRAFCLEGDSHPAG